MEELNVTAATIMRFAETLEDKSATLYEQLAAQFPQHKERWLGYARDSKKNKVLMVRTYQETITDALEACFSFEGLNLQDYAVAEFSVPGVSLAQALGRIMALEEKAVRFYSDVASRCESLLGTIPRAFRRVAEVRSKRLAELQNLK